MKRFPEYAEMMLKNSGNSQILKILVQTKGMMLENPVNPF
jgi:hypothetical protein